MKKSILILGLSALSVGSFATKNLLDLPSPLFEVENKSKVEIDPANLPDSVKQIISQKHPGASISKAYEWHRGDHLMGYEVVITQSDKKDEVVKFDKDGKLVRGLDN